MGVKNLDSMTYIEELGNQCKNPRGATRNTICMTYELYSIHSESWVLVDVVTYIPVRHPLRHHGKWGGAHQ
jgi:hypothetical protein